MISCSTPDLADPSVFSEAKNQAVDFKSLERKFMYEMFHLYVHTDDKPYTGWVKKCNDANQLIELGYLSKGRKDGLWISWDDEGGKISEIYWQDDRMDGPFSVWHPSGQSKVIGQTRDGEVDGKWTEYYTSGRMAYQSINRLGHLEEIKVWRPDGSLCQESGVIDGNGSFYRYFEDGSIELFRTFLKGVETSRKNFNQR